MADTTTGIEGATPEEQADTEVTEPTTDTGAADSDDTSGPDGATPTGEPQPTDSLGDAGKRALEAERRARREAEQQLKKVRAEAARNAEAAQRLQESEDLGKTELEKLAEQVKHLQAENETSKLRAMRSEVARTTGVPVELLTATTDDDLTAQAEALKEWADAEAEKHKPKAPAKPAPAKPKEKLRSGAENGKSGMSREDVVAAVLSRRGK
jgi:hypothetical protein